MPIVMVVCLFQWQFEIRRREHGPKFDATGAGAKHAWSRSLPIFRWGKMPRLHTGDTALDLRMLERLGGPSIIVPAWSRPNVLALAVHNWPSPPPSPALSTSVTADEPWPSAQPAQPARWRSRMLDRGKTYPSPAAPPIPHEYLCVTLPLYLPFLSRPCVETCTNGYQPGNHPWPQPGISLETLLGLNTEHCTCSFIAMLIWDQVLQDGRGISTLNHSSCFYSHLPWQVEP